MYPHFLITLNKECDRCPSPSTLVRRVRAAVLGLVSVTDHVLPLMCGPTHQTPIQLGATERAALAAEKFILFVHMEDFVILQKILGWVMKV